MVIAQELADTSQSWVIVNLEQLLTVFLCIGFHAAEFIYSEWFSVQYYSFLAIKGLTTTTFD
jgi:hypothetical protein